MERKGKFTRGPVVTSEYYSNATTILDAGGFAFAEAETCAIMENYGARLNIDHWGLSKDSHRDVDRKEQRANAALIASAFNAATACEDMGYDGEACVKALPELVDVLNGLARAYAGTPGAITVDGSWYSHSVCILAKCRC